MELFESWGEIDRSHRKLAHRGSRLDLVHVSESTVRRVLAAEGLTLQGSPPREPTARQPWPDWLEWKPNRIWGYDFTHFTRADRAVVAILDVVSRRWLATVVSAEESSTQVEVAFIDALEAEDLWQAADQRATAALVSALACGDRDAVATAIGDGQRAAAVGHLGQRLADAQLLHPRVPRRRRHRPTVRPPRRTPINRLIRGSSLVRHAERVGLPTFGERAVIHRSRDESTTTDRAMRAELGIGRQQRWWLRVAQRVPRSSR